MHSFYVLSLLILTVGFISACGVTNKSTDPTAPPRTVDVSETENASVLEDGMASWYGPNFDGKLTANGEIYDMNGVTAAHRTLPFGTILLVENLDNGKTVQVRVNDRGPYAKDRIIDLSKGAAEAVDMIGPGTANVRLYLLEGDLKNSRITDIKVPTYTVQLASYKKREQAEKKQAEIKGSRVETISRDNQTLYRLYYGTFTDPEEAKKEMKRLKRMGYAGFVKQIENN